MIIRVVYKLNVIVVVILIDQHLLQLSSSSDMPSNAVQVLDVLIQYLVVEHIDYAVELGLQGRPTCQNNHRFIAEILLFLFHSKWCRYDSLKCS